MFIDVKQHPYLPAGTVLFDVNRLQETYSNSRLGETRGVFVRRDTYGIEFAQTSRKYPVRCVLRRGAGGQDAEPALTR